MPDYPFQTTIVGKDAIPKYPRKSKWNYLSSMLNELNTGQVIRIVLPKGVPRSGVIQAWFKMTKARRLQGHTRTIKQAEGGSVIYLWYAK